MNPSECEKRDVGSKCLASCDLGFKKSGNEVRTCVLDTSGKTAKWCDTKLTCAPNMCKQLVVPSAGTMSCLGNSVSSKMPVRSSCKFGCKKGYDLVGTAVLQCMPDGQWSGSTASCTAKKCRKTLKTPAGGYMKCDGSHYGKKCTFSCGAGLSPHGDKVRRCGSNGVWSGSDFKCVGLTFGAKVTLQSHWKDYLSETKPECQNIAKNGCRCENWDIKKKEWGMKGAACCAQPAQMKRARPWCYCENPSMGTNPGNLEPGGWAYCEAGRPEMSTRVDHVPKHPDSSTTFTIEKYDSKKKRKPHCVRRCCGPQKPK